MLATTKAKNRHFDLLSWSFVLAAALFTMVSIPATFEMTSIAHSPVMAVAMVAVLEVLAFGSKLGSRWVPSWGSTLDRITISLLSLTTIGNYGAGWDYIWQERNVPITGFWLGVRNYQVWGIYPGSIFVVLVLSALVPTGIYLFLSLFCRRQAELDILHTPEAAAERVLEPVILQLRTVGRLQEELRGLNAVLYPKSLTDSQPGLYNYEDLERLSAPEVKTLEDNTLQRNYNEVAAVLERRNREVEDLRKQLDALQTPARVEVSAPKPDHVMPFSDELGDDIPPPETISLNGVTAYPYRVDTIPVGEPRVIANVPTEVAPAGVCEGCGGATTNSDKGIAKRSSKPLYCKTCRDAAR